MRRTLRLRVDIAEGPDADAERLAQLTSSLRSQLLELDVDNIGRGTDGPVPPGAKGLPGGELGTLLVSLSDSAVLVALVGVLRSWLGRNKNRRVAISLGEDTLEVTNASAEEQAKLIESWLSSHDGPG